ncbi:MAG TPA: type II secretion system major pseudopilin GspG [Opitutaceae bacterium]|nr:type II secretion system major pseudopilin GspG [Opitutaceae bacterium]
MLRNPEKSRGRRAAFTLFEILIVVALIALLAGVAVVNADKVFGQNQEQVAKIFVKQSLEVPLTSYKIAMGGYPTTEEGLQALVTAPASGAERWRGPYIKTDGGKLPADPWGTPYLYRYPGAHNTDRYDVWSAGQDRKDGTADDIGNW